jgi:hypothetical protein
MPNETPGRDHTADPAPALLTITEAAELLRAPSRRSATGGTWAPARPASASAAASSTAATTSTPGSTPVAATAPLRRHDPRITHPSLPRPEAAERLRCTQPGRW